MDSPLFEEFIDALNRHDVKYLIVGAHALAIHAVPRATKDLDVWIEATSENAERVVKAITTFFGGASIGQRAEDFTEPYSVIQLGMPPHRIDILCSLSGNPSFAEEWNARLDAKFGAVTAHFIRLSAYIAVKRASGRPRDLADLEALERAEKELRKETE